MVLESEWEPRLPPCTDAASLSMVLLMTTEQC